MGFMAACAYETVAIASDMTRRSRPPTISDMCSRHRYLSMIVLAGMAVHLMPRSRSDPAAYLPVDAF
jgi:hypothetical protein